MRAHPCAGCESATDHCHGTLIVHVGRGAECTTQQCVDLDHARHLYIVDCLDVAGGCSCVPAEIATGIA